MSNKDEMMHASVANVKWNAPLVPSNKRHKWHNVRHIVWHSVPLCPCYSSIRMRWSLCCTVSLVGRHT